MTTLHRQSLSRPGTTNPLTHQKPRKDYTFNSGDKVFIRTVTFHHVGEVVEVEDGFVVLKDASWVADDGRFGGAIETGSLSEVEYVGEFAVSVATIVDVCPWRHDLPSETK